MEQSNFTIETTRFNDVSAEFHERVAHMVWCNVASVDDACRPRSRIRIALLDFPAPPGRVIVWKA